MNWYLGALKKYADFSGRARRREYWFFVLFNIIISIVLTICDVFVGTYNAAASIVIDEIAPAIVTRSAHNGHLIAVNSS